MTEQERLEVVKEFLNRADLEGTELKLKSKVLILNQKLATAQADSQKLNEQLQQTQLTANNKRLEVMGLSERLDGLCDLVLDLEKETLPITEQ